MRHWFAFVAISMIATAAVADDSTVRIDLGGMRSVVADLTTTEEQYTVAVRMRAVGAFDRATNTRLNRQKARAYALQALARHLTGDNAKRISITVEGATVSDTSLDGKSYHLTLLVPRSGAEVVSKERPSIDDESELMVESVALDNDLLSRKQDYLDTLGNLRAGSTSEIQALTEQAAGPDDAFYEAIADIEERSLKCLDQLDAEAKSDKLLLGIERDEIIQATQQERERLLGSLRQAVEAAESTSTKEGEP